MLDLYLKGQKVNFDVSTQKEAQVQVYSIHHFCDAMSPPISAITI